MSFSRRTGRGLGRMRVKRWGCIWILLLGRRWLELLLGGKTGMVLEGEG